MFGATVWNPAGIGLTLMNAPLYVTTEHQLYTGNPELDLGLAQGVLI